MSNKNIGRKFLSDLKLYSDFLGWDEENKRYETFEEAVHDVMQTHRTKYADKVEQLEPYLQFVEKMYKEKRFLGSMRGLQFRGKDIFKHEFRLYNCLVGYADKASFLGNMFYLALCGCGTGINMMLPFIQRLPRLEKRKRGTKTFIIEDSIEGWSNAAHALISSYIESSYDAIEGFEEYQGYEIKFDYSLIRPRGAKVGRRYLAPGPKGLKNALDKIEDLLNNYLSDNNLGNPFTTIIAYDCFMHLMNAVLSGGIRRAAASVIFSPDDIDMINCKAEGWRVKNPQRERSNNSVGLIKGVFTKQEFLDVLALNRSNNDIGFVFLNNIFEIFNPCFEIGFTPLYIRSAGYIRSDGVKHIDLVTRIQQSDISVLDEGVSTGIQCCVAGTTKLITKQGLETIEDCIDKEIEIWNGENWKKVKPFQTGTSDNLYRVQFGDGSYLDATSNHKFLVKNRFEKNFKEIETKDLIILLDTSPYTLQIPRANINYETGISIKEAFDYGFILGDGWAGRNMVQANLYNEDKRIKFVTGKLVGTYLDKNKKEYQTITFKVNYDFCLRLKYEQGLPNEIFTWNKKSILQFIAGWADADGCKAGNGIRIYGREDKIKDLQLLLTKCGINSSFNLMEEKDVKTNISYRKNAVYYVQIVRTNEIPLQRIKSYNNLNATGKGMFQIIKKITKLDGQHKSYCLTEESLHQCVFNNVLTKQCNLVEGDMSKCKNREDFIRMCEAEAIMGTLQAGYTNFSHIKDCLFETIEISRAEALLGVSFSGLFNNPWILEHPEILKEGAETVLRVNKVIAAILGINPTARATCGKPGGDGPVVLGCNTPPEHSKRYFRVMQLNKDTETAKYIEESMPWLIEESTHSENHTDYVVFVPIENEDGTMYKDDLKGIKHLKVIKTLMDNWVSPGTVADRCIIPGTSHNISNTVIVDPEDYEEVANYIYENQDSFRAVSFISSFGDKDYNQCPNTSVLTGEEIIKKYGETAMFASGLIIDALHAFDDNLWDACEATTNRNYKLTGNRVTVLIKKDIIRRFKKFAKNYFKNNIQEMIYCLKDVHIYHKWCTINRQFRPVDFTEILTKPTYIEIDSLAAKSCSGTQCSI